MDRREDLLYRTGSLTEYRAYISRLVEDDRRRERQQQILETMSAEGLPRLLWINVGKETYPGGRFVRLDLEESREETSSALEPLPAELRGDARQPELPAVPPDKRFRLYSVRAEALDAIPPEARPDDVVRISEHLDGLDQLNVNTRTLFDWYEKAFPVAGITLLLFPSALYYALNLGSLIPISGGVTLMFSLLSCFAVLAAYLIVRDKDYRVGPAGVRDKKIALWKRYRRLNPAKAAAHYDAALSAVQVNQYRRRTWAPDDARQERKLKELL